MYQTFYPCEKIVKMFILRKTQSPVHSKSICKNFEDAKTQDKNITMF